ncbi:MAG: hypothetical protein E7266_06435 [Lachnospiraceae bacterium]|nr:hypothetical protein [Lachnospiraceae bacterium]
MKIKDYLSAALWEVKAGKRKVFFITVFMFIGLMMLILTNVTEKNILDYLDRGILETPALKTVIVYDEKLFEQLKSDERVADTYIYAGIWSPNFENSKELIGVETNQIDVQSYSKVYEDYIIAGRGIENENEIIVPKYLIEYGNLSSSEYIDMEDCLGKKIVVSDCRFNIYTDEELGEVNYEFTVVGVIDNLALSVYGFFAEEESINDKKKRTCR